jgi:hypothetical protein
MDNVYFLLLTRQHPIYKNMWNVFIHDEHRSNEFIQWIQNNNECEIYPAYPYLLTFSSRLRYSTFLLRWS